MAVDTLDRSSEFDQNTLDKANEVGTTPAAQSKIDEQQNKENGAVADNNHQRKQREASYLDQIGAYLKNSLPGRFFYQDDESNEILAKLNGERGPEEQKETWRRIQAAMDRFQQAKQAPGDGSWLNVMDPFFRAMMAYIELRKAQGYPDTFVGRTVMLGRGAIDSVRQSLPVAFAEGCWNICSKAVKEFKGNDEEQPFQSTPNDAASSELEEEESSFTPL